MPEPGYSSQTKSVSLVKNELSCRFYKYRWKYDVLVIRTNRNYTIQEMLPLPEGRLRYLVLPEKVKNNIATQMYPLFLAYGDVGCGTVHLYKAGKSCVQLINS